MLTPEVEKYLDKKFEEELDAKDIVKDLVSGGWRESDAATVVRQYETKHAFADAPALSDDTPPSPNKNKIDFSKVGSHGKQEGVEIGEDFIPKKEPETIAKQKKEVSEEDIEKTEKEHVEKERKAKEDSLISARVDENASYDDLVSTFDAMGTPKDRRELHRNNNGGNPDPYKAPDVTFNPLDINPPKKPSPKKKEKVATPVKEVQPKKHSKDTGRKKVLLLLVFVWFLVVAVVGGLYYLFVYQQQSSPEQESVLEEVPESLVTVRSVRTTPLDQPGQMQGTITGATCEDDMNCFVLGGKTCDQVVSVERTRETIFFSSKKGVRSYLELSPGPENKCLFQSEIISVKTDFTADIAQETVDSVRLSDQRAVGLAGRCLISKFEIERFLEKLQENSLTDLDYLSLGCTGEIYEQDEINI